MAVPVQCAHHVCEHLFSPTVSACGSRKAIIPPGTTCSGRNQFERSELFYTFQKRRPSLAEFRIYALNLYCSLNVHETGLIAVDIFPYLSVFEDSNRSKYPRLRHVRFPWRHQTVHDDVFVRRVHPASVSFPTSVRKAWSPPMFLFAFPSQLPS